MNKISQIPEITVEALNKLLYFIDFFQGLDAVVSEEEKRNRLDCDEFDEFYNELCNTGFLLVFDWKSWLNENEVYKNIENDIEEHIMKADLVKLRKLMTSYIRGDRFNEGLFHRVIINGHITKILTRLRVIMQSKSEEGAD